MSTQTFKDAAAATKHREGVGTGADSSNGFSAAFVPLGHTSTAGITMADALANPATVMIAGLNLVYNGTTWDRLRGDTTNGAWVNVKASALPTGAATLAEQQTQSASIGATNETSAASDSATAGLNGLIKRLLARLTALLPAALTGGGGIKAGLVDALPAGTNLVGKVSIDQATANANEVVTKAGSVTAATLGAETTKIIGTVNIAAAQTLATVTTVGTVTTVSTLTSLSQFGGQAITLGAGAVAGGTLRITAASDDPAVVSLGIIDDWDESDRCKTNPIVGQAGVAGGSGVVGATVQRVVLATDVPLPAGTNLIGKTAAGGVSDVIYDGTTALTVKRAKIGCATSGENTIVAAVTSKKIRVIGMFLANAAGASAVNFYFKDGAGGTAIFGDGTYQITLDRTGATGFSAFSLARNEGGHFESASGAALILNLSAANGVAGFLSYVEA